MVRLVAAVGMAAGIPHNLGELVDATVELIDRNPEATVNRLLNM